MRLESWESCNIAAIKIDEIPKVQKKQTAFQSLGLLLLFVGFLGYPLLFEISKIFHLPFKAGFVWLYIFDPILRCHLFFGGLKILEFFFDPLQMISTFSRNKISYPNHGFLLRINNKPINQKWTSIFFWGSKNISTNICVYCSLLMAFSYVSVDPIFWVVIYKFLSFQQNYHLIFMEIQGYPPMPHPPGNKALRDSWPPVA